MLVPVRNFWRLTVVIELSELLYWTTYVPQQEQGFKKQAVRAMIYILT